MEAGNFLWKSELSSLTVKYGSEQNVGVNLQQTRLCLHMDVFVCRFMNIIWTRFPPKRWLISFSFLFFFFWWKWSTGPNARSGRYTAAVHVAPELTAYRSASCYITIAFLTMLFTPLAWEKIAPLWILHHSGTLMSAQMDFLKLTFSKSLSRFYSILIWRYQQQK